MSVSSQKNITSPAYNRQRKSQRDAYMNIFLHIFFDLFFKFLLFFELFPPLPLGVQPPGTLACIWGIKKPQQAVLTATLLS